MRLSFHLLPHLLLASSAIATASPPTAIHEAGRCAVRGHCGKQGFFGKDLPCPDNGLAEQPADDVRKKLVSICGDKWAEGPVCCAEEQVRLRYCGAWWCLGSSRSTRLVLSATISNVLRRSSLHAQLVKRISTTSSAHLLAPQISHSL